MLEYDDTLSNFAFKFNLRGYTAVGLAVVSLHFPAPASVLGRRSSTPADATPCEEAVTGLLRNNVFYADKMSAASLCRCDPTLGAGTAGLSELMVNWRGHRPTSPKATVVLMGHSPARAAFNYKRIFSQYLNQGDVLDSLVFLWANQVRAHFRLFSLDVPHLFAAHGPLPYERAFSVYCS